MIQKNKEKRKVVTFTTSHGRESFELHFDTSPALFDKVKRLAQLCGKAQTKGVLISDADKLAIKNLPSAIHNKFIEKGLIDGVSTRKIPTLSQFLDQAIPATGVERTQVKREQYRNYLLEYHTDVRIDTITDIHANGIVRYLKEDRQPNLAQYTISRAITAFRSYFDKAVEWGYIVKNPYNKVHVPKVPDKERRVYVTKDMIDFALGCLKDVELEGILAFSRFAGFRGESEWKPLRFADIEFELDGSGTIRVSEQGKTGERYVPIFDDLRPYLDALFDSRLPDQEFVFEKYRDVSNVRSVIEKKMKRAGVEIWPVLFTNCRRSFFQDKANEGFSEQRLTMMGGNSSAVRRGYYDLGTSRSDIAGWSRRSSGRDLVSITPGSEKCATKSATVELEKVSFDKNWYDMLSDGTSDTEIIVSMLVMDGFSEVTARALAANNPVTSRLAKDIRSICYYVYEYHAGRISYFKLVISAIIPVLRMHWGEFTQKQLYMIYLSENFRKIRREHYKKQALLAEAGLDTQGSRIKIFLKIVLWPCVRYSITSRHTVSRVALQHAVFRAVFLARTPRRPGRLTRFPPMRGVRHVTSSHRTEFRKNGLLSRQERKDAKWRGYREDFATEKTQRLASKARRRERAKKVPKRPGRYTEAGVSPGTTNPLKDRLPS